MSDDSIPSMNKAQMYDLYKLDRDAKKSFGLGFFPQVFSDILERYYTIGEIDINKANTALAEFYRAKNEFIGSDEKCVDDETSKIDN